MILYVVKNDEDMIPLGGRVSSRPGGICQSPGQKKGYGLPHFFTRGEKPFFWCHKSLRNKGVERRYGLFPEVCAKIQEWLNLTPFSFRFAFRPMGSLLF